MKGILRNAMWWFLVVTAFTGGLAAGLWAAKGNLLTNAGEVVAAALGAAIAVLGAAWYSNSQGDEQRRNLQAILAGSVQQVLTSANHVVTRCTPEQNGTAAIYPDVRAVLHRWMHLHNFSPYRELGNFGMVDCLSEVDSACLALQEMLESNQEVSRRPMTFGSDTHSAILRTMAFRASRGTWHDKEEFADAANAIALACEKALRALDTARPRWGLRYLPK